MGNYKMPVVCMRVWGVRVCMYHAVFSKWRAVGSHASVILVQFPMPSIFCCFYKL